MDRRTPSLPLPLAHADDRLGSIVREVESDLRMRVYSHKYSIISFLHERPGASSSEILGHCRSASSTFYKCLKELQAANILTNASSSADMRHQYYNIAPTVKSVLDDAHRTIGRYFDRRMHRHNDRAIGIIHSVRSIEQELGIRYYSPEYEAVMYLYEQGHVTAQALCANSSSANAAFYAMLKRLADAGTVDPFRSSINKRQKWYRLSQTTAAVLDAAHARIVNAKLL